MRPIGLLQASTAPSYEALNLFPAREHATSVSPYLRSSVDRRLRIDLLNQVFSIIQRRAGLRPKLHHWCNSSIADLKKLNSAGLLHAISNGNISDRLDIIPDNSLHRTLP